MLEARTLMKERGDTIDGEVIRCLVVFIVDTPYGQVRAVRQSLLKTLNWRPDCNLFALVLLNPPTASD